MKDIKTVRAEGIEIGYLDEGVADLGTIFLLHGWPDDPHGWDEIAPTLAEEGWRIVRPWLRGFGPTRLSGQSAGTGDLGALAQDVLTLADALNLDRFGVVGHDWGARAAYIVACSLPERVSRCVGMSVGWGTNDADQKLELRQVQNYWYHWYMALDAGAKLVREDRRAFTRYIWDIWSVARPIEDSRFERLAESFDNPDWADVVLHSYRVRWGLAEPGPDGIALTDRIVANPIITVPTLTIHGGSDPCNHPSTSENKERFFTGSYRREVMNGIGHFPQWEAPERTAALLTAFLRPGHM